MATIIRTLLGITFILTTTLVSSQTTCSPISTHCFNGNTSDGSGNNRNGTNRGNAVFDVDRNGKPASALKFDGINDFVELPNGVDYALDNVTYACWVYVTALPNAGTSTSIVAVGNSGGDVHILLNNYPQFGYYGFSAGCYNVSGSAFRSIVGSMPTINRWYHLALTRTNESVTLYVNGVSNGTTRFQSSKAKYSIPTLASIGRRHPSIPQYFEGKIDDVRFYNCAKTANEIIAIYKSYGCSDTCKNVVTVYDTNRISVFDTVSVYDTVPVFDTTRITIVDTITVYDTIRVHDTMHVGIQSIGTENSSEVLVFPNPTQDEVTVKLKDNALEVSYEVYSIGGKLYKREQVGTIQIFSVKLPEEKGMYFLNVYDSNNLLFSRKLIKE